MMVRHGYDSPSLDIVLLFSERTEDDTIIPCDSNGISSVNLHVSNPNT